jgi:hypothetical protein
MERVRSNRSPTVAGRKRSVATGKEPNALPYGRASEGRLVRTGLRFAADALSGTYTARFQSRIIRGRRLEC